MKIPRRARDGGFFCFYSSPGRAGRAGQARTRQIGCLKKSQLRSSSFCITSITGSVLQKVSPVPNAAIVGLVYQRLQTQRILRKHPAVVTCKLVFTVGYKGALVQRQAAR